MKQNITEDTSMIIRNEVVDLEKLITALRKEVDEEKADYRAAFRANGNNPIPGEHAWVKKIEDIFKKIKKIEDKLKTTKQNGVKEEMKININEDRVDWKFSSDKENITVNSQNLNFTLDSENAEKLIKGINNHEITVVRDETEEPVKKYVFSPRGSSVLVKQVGSPDGYLMTSKDVEGLIAAATPKKIEHGDDEEEVKEAHGFKFVTYGLTAEDLKRRDKEKDFKPVGMGSIVDTDKSKVTPNAIAKAKGMTRVAKYVALAVYQFLSNSEKEVDFVKIE